MSPVLSQQIFQDNVIQQRVGQQTFQLSVLILQRLQAMGDHDISQRRACRLVGVDPKTVRRDQPPDDLEVREEMKAIASKRRRFGYRRIGVLMERKGMILSAIMELNLPVMRSQNGLKIAA